MAESRSRGHIYQADGEPLHGGAGSTDAGPPEEAVASSGAAPPTTASGRKGYRDYFPDGAVTEHDPDLPQPGDRIWYRIRTDGRWVRAVVIDPVVEGYDDPIGYRSLHLAIETAADYHQTSPEGDPGGTPLAAAPVGFRQNVVEGTDWGEWQRKKPPGADAAYATERRRHLENVEERRQMAREGGLQATHRGKLPRGTT